MTEKVKVTQKQENQIETERLAIPDAVLHLKEQGYKIEKSKLYEDKHIIGFSNLGGSTVFTKKDLDRYAKKFLPLLADSNSFTTEEKLKWDIKISEQKFKDMEFEAKLKEGQYVLKSEVEQMLAARAAFFKNSLEGFFRSMAPKLIEKAGGDMTCTPEVVELCLTELDKLLDYYSKPLTFSVPMSEIQKFIEAKE